MSSEIKAKIQEDMKTAMRNKETERLGTIRLILAAVKQKEVDERIELSDEHVLAILDKMLKQRRDSISQFQTANRADLVAKETAEMDVIHTYLPAQLSDAEITNLIDKTIKETAATSAKDMGKVMAALKSQVQGRADVAAVSKKVKEKLG
ncbi:glutamyl-tRNA amidotransferase [Gammaproteobacteria bacterium SCGC AG-212-F23]|nr:glutamyl-tRNA amidotransferase [Gammaproteobacteria bacterium SCGC AG-212-F23]